MDRRGLEAHSTDGQNVDDDRIWVYAAYLQMPSVKLSFEQSTPQYTMYLDFITVGAGNQL